MENIASQFTAAFITDDRWKLYLGGLGVTVEIALFAEIIGLILGTIIALMKLTKKRDGSRTVVAVIADAYIDVIRGTPSVLQLLIMWFIIMKNSQNGILVASLSFGLNSAAYEAEIIRGGILSVDKGQTEAGRSLGLSAIQTLRYIVLPQAFKTAIPTMCNEFITLLKETAIVGYVSLADLTRIANQISSATYQPFMPLIGAAVIYLVVIKILSTLFGMLERRLRQSDYR